LGGVFWILSPITQPTTRPKTRRDGRRVDPIDCWRREANMIRTNPIPAMLCVALLLIGRVAVTRADEFDREPISYSTSEPRNCVSQLQEKLDKGETTLEYDSQFGYLPALLDALGVHRDSQSLVFSKTSLQRQRISPRTPRSIYFNDEVYVGYCQRGDVLEISAVDPQLGTVFYTLDQTETRSPRFSREIDNCLLCHASSHTESVPGHLIRSVFTDASGNPMVGYGSYRVNQNTPFENRWGGWYVTGRHGEQTHLGNLVVRDKGAGNRPDNKDGQNVTDLSGRYRTSSTLTPHSDLVALLVLEHQATAHNLITRANFTARHALHYEAALNRELKEPADKRWDSTNTRIRNAARSLVKYMLFSGEPVFTSPVSGTSSFAVTFAERGPRDKAGRSLRDFDLRRRMFRYPCSYLVYSPSFQQLPDEMRAEVFSQMHAVLSGADTSADFSHLTSEDRTAIREILRDTLPGPPSEW
jgi:hypothetical protein